MNRGIWLAASLVLAGPPAAWAQQAGRTAGTKPATAGKTTGTGKDVGKPAAKSDGKTNGEPQLSRARQKMLEKKGIKTTEPEDGISPAVRARVRRTKSVFMYAAESCERAGDRCDPTLRDDAEERFMEACGACTTSERCEKERAAIRAGTARSSSDPCAPPK